MTERQEILQDINAMLHARSLPVLDDIRRAMEGLGRWTVDAQRVYTRVAAVLREGIDK